MKKYIIAGLLVFSVFVPVASFAQVLPGDVDPAPDNSDCISITNNLRYRSRDINTNGEVSTLQDFLQSQNYLNSEPTGYFGLLTLKAVKDFQSANSINPTGYVVPITRAKISTLTCGTTTDPLPTYPIPGCPPGALYNSQTGERCVTTTPTFPPGCSSNSGYSSTTGQPCGNNNPVISGVSGPQSLNVNETGTWKVTASDSSGGNLSYSVYWGDEAPVAYPTGTMSPIRMSAPQQSATFTHSYSQAGIYTPVFTVDNDRGQGAKTSLSVNVGEVVNPNNNYPKIVGYPAIPTNIQPGQIVSFSWSAADADNDDLGWSVDWGDGIGPTSTCIMNPPKGTGQNWSFSASHAWSKMGTYILQITVYDCRGGSFSDSIKIVVGLTTQSSITVLSPNGGETWTKGTTQIIKWQDNKVAQYDVFLVPYQAPCTSNICPMTSLNAYPYHVPYTIAKNVYSSSSNFQGSYAWSVGTRMPLNYNDEKNIVPDGAYTIQVCDTATDGCDSSDSYFKITSNTTQPSITITSPNGGETYFIPGTTENSIIKVRWQTNNVSSSQNLDIIRLRAYPNGKEYNLASNVINDGQEAIAIPSNVPVGAYTLEIKTYVNGTLVMDSSDSYFKIVSETSTNSFPKIGPFSIPNNITAGQSTSFTFSATDADNDDLFWSVDWGEGVGSGSACPVNPPSGTGQNWSYSAPHTWNQAGTYLIQVYVNDCRGGSASTAFDLKVVGTSYPLTITTSSPLPNAKVGNAYSTNIVASGVVAPFSWSLSGTGLPPGLSLLYGDNLGISGTPTTAGTYNFTVTITSGSSTSTGGVRTTSKQFTLTVDSVTTSAPTITSVTPTAVVSGQTTITIVGTNLRNTSNGAVNVQFFDNNGARNTVVGISNAGGTQVTATVPADMVGPSGYVRMDNGTDLISNSIVLQIGAGDVLGIQSFYFTQWLQRGSYGNEVIELQKFLNTAGYDSGTADGKFGLQTEAALIKFQIANNLKGDGIVGYEVRTFLNK